MQTGKIVQVMGPVVDVEFMENPLPTIKTALTVDNHGVSATMEVADHLGDNTVRCIMLAPSEGLERYGGGFHREGNLRSCRGRNPWKTL